MPVAYLFWLFFILLAICTCPRPILGPYGAWGGWFLVLLLFGLLGWHEFGSIVK